MTPKLTLSLVLLLAAPTAQAARADDLSTKPDFNRDIRPILANHCFTCHGPDASHRKGGLRLDARGDALEGEGLTPSPPAEKTTLIRRVTLDLTGLPPTPVDVDDFLADTSPEAYQKVVERLLASVHYGERMAVDWLDAARFADSNGYQVD